MIVKDLIKKLQTVNQDARVVMGYDGNIVVTPAGEVEELLTPEQLGSCWYRAKVGDVVILEPKNRWE